MAAIAAPIVLTPMLVPAVVPTETSELKINGKRKTPKTKPTMPPTKPITNPTADRNYKEMRFGSMLSNLSLYYNILREMKFNSTDDIPFLIQ